MISLLFITEIEAMSYAEQFFIPDYEEDVGVLGEEEESAPKRKCDGTVVRVEGRACTLCGDSLGGAARRHVSREHLPWFLNPDRCCWNCHGVEDSSSYIVHHHHFKVAGHDQFGTFDNYNFRKWLGLMRGVLTLFQEFFGSNDSSALLQVVRCRHLYPDDPTFVVSPLQHMLMSTFDRVLGLEPKPKYTLRPPNSVASLLHWAVMVAMLQPLTNDQRMMVKRSVREERVSLPCVEAVDAHCHLDQVLQKRKVAWRPGQSVVRNLESASSHLFTQFSSDQSVDSISGGAARFVFRGPAPT